MTEAKPNDPCARCGHRRVLHWDGCGGFCIVCGIRSRSIREGVGGTFFNWKAVSCAAFEEKPSRTEGAP